MILAKIERRERWRHVTHKPEEYTDDELFRLEREYPPEIAPCRACDGKGIRANLGYSYECYRCKGRKTCIISSDIVRAMQFYRSLPK